MPRPGRSSVALLAASAGLMAVARVLWSGDGRSSPAAGAGLPGVPRGSRGTVESSRVWAYGRSVTGYWGDQCRYIALAIWLAHRRIRRTQQASAPPTRKENVS